MTNSPYKILIVDIDGTLVGNDGIISAENSEALAKVRDSGIRVSLSTGRSSQACGDIIDQLSLDGYHIFFDGALVANLELSKEFYVQPLSQAVVKEAIEFAHSNDIDLDIYSTTHYFVERETWSAVAHRQFFNIKPTVVDFTNLWERERIIKIGLVATSAQERDKTKLFCSNFDRRCHLSWARTPAYLGVDFINVVAPGVSKGKALEELASHLGISLSETMAIGDGANDISLLSTAGLAVAMGNALDEVKAIADHITGDVDHNGITAAINKFLL